MTPPHTGPQLNSGIRFSAGPLASNSQLRSWKPRRILTTLRVTVATDWWAALCFGHLQTGMFR